MKGPLSESRVAIHFSVQLPTQGREAAKKPGPRADRFKYTGEGTGQQAAPSEIDRKRPGHGSALLL